MAKIDVLDERMNNLIRENNLAHNEIEDQLTKLLLEKGVLKQFIKSYVPK